jgi:hypothetical protein
MEHGVRGMQERWWGVIWSVRCVVLECTSQLAFPSENAKLNSDYSWIVAQFFPSSLHAILPVSALHA